MATLEGMAHFEATRGGVLDDSQDPGTGDTGIVSLYSTPVRSLDLCHCDLRVGDLLDASTVSLIGQYFRSLIAYLTVTSTSDFCAFWPVPSWREAFALALADEAGEESLIADLCSEADEEPESVVPGRVPTMEEYVQQVRMWAEMYDQEPVDLTSEELAAYYDRIAPFEPED